MLEPDFEELPAQYVAQNLIEDIGAASELTYDEDALGEEFVTGPSSFEERNGQMMMATMESYKRESPCWI